MPCMRSILVVPGGIGLNFAFHVTLRKWSDDPIQILVFQRPYHTLCHRNTSKLADCTISILDTVVVAPLSESMGIELNASVGNKILRFDLVFSVFSTIIDE